MNYREKLKVDKMLIFVILTSFSKNEECQVNDNPFFVNLCDLSMQLEKHHK